MAWIVVDYDGTLVEKAPTEMGDAQDSPIPGASEAMATLVQEGHRVTVYTSRFAPMPESEKHRVKTQLEQELASWGFPSLEIWTGTTKPDADLFIGSSHVTFDNDWGLALAQTQLMLEERGLLPGPSMPMDDEAQP